jgi:hypothetical protein
MIVVMLLASLAQSTPATAQIEVEVRNRVTGQLIGSAEVVMEDGSNAPQRHRTRAGRSRFTVNCTDDVKFWAEAPNDPAYPVASQPRACQPLPVVIKLRPGS